MFKQCQISEQPNVLEALEFDEEVQEVYINRKRILLHHSFVVDTQAGIIPKLHEQRRCNRKVFNSMLTGWDDSGLLLEKDDVTEIVGVYVLERYYTHHCRLEKPGTMANVALTCKPVGAEEESASTTLE